MRAFGYEERDRFFGRDQQSYALYRLLSFGFIAVIGNSGSGKSSLVRAGLLPILLDSGETARWKIATMTPSGEPLDRLGAAIASLGPDDEDDDARSIRQERIAYRLRLSSAGIADALEEMPHLANDAILLVVDQFEEIFRSTSPAAGEQNEAFVQLLLEFHRRRPSGRVLITMRSDFIGDCALFPGLPEAVSDTQYLVPTLTREQRRAAIVKPIEKANATIESDLVERLLNEEEFGTDLLPVLQHALARMWIVARDRSPEAVRVIDADYRAIGTLEGAITKHADGVLGSLAGRENVAESVFRALSERDSEGRAIRRSVSLRQLVAETGLPEGDVRAVVDRFRAPDCAFLLPSGGSLTSDSAVDVVHEALLRRWERLTPGDTAYKGWLDREWSDGQYYRSILARIDSGETALQLDRVMERYAWWTDVPHTSAWADRYGGRHERVDAFFTTSLAALAESNRASARAETEARERHEHKERATRRFLVVTGSIATIAIALLVVTFFALLGAQRATNASLVTQSKLVSRDAKSLTDRGDATNAALLALEMLPQRLADPDRPFTWAAYGALTDSLANVREVRDYRLAGSVTRIEYSPDGTRFVARQSNGTIWIWKIGALTPEFVLHAQSFARDVEFSADGTFVASGSNDGSIHVWSARTGKIGRVIRACRGAVNRTVFTADGRRLLISCDQENVTRLYDVSTGIALREVPGGADWRWPTQGTLSHRTMTMDLRQITVWNASLTKAIHVFRPAAVPIVYAALARNEDKLVIAYADRTAAVFDAITGRRIARLVSRERTSGLVRFDPTGSYVFDAGQTYVHIWNAATGAALTTIATDNDSVFPSISGDGKKFLLPSGDGSIGEYSTEIGARLVNLAGIASSVNDGAFSPDGRRVLLAGLSDGIVREWDMSRNTSRILDETTRSGLLSDGYSNISVTPDGSTIAIAGDSAIRFYDANSGNRIRSLPDVSALASDGVELALSPDGRTLIDSASNIRGTQRWDWRHWMRPSFFTAQPRTISDYDHPVYAPDGRTFATTSRGVVYIEDAVNGRVRLSISANHFSVNALAFSADSRRIVIGNNEGWLRVYDARSGKNMLAFPAHLNWIVTARFSPDGDFIASASWDQTVRVWNATSGALVATLYTTGKANSAAFSADGRRLLVASDDGVRIWDIATNRTIETFRGFLGGINYAEYALHDSRIVTVGSDNTARLWPVPDLPVCQNAIDAARARMAHGLSPALRDAEFITQRHTPSLLNTLLPRDTCFR